uniref:Uncharacterized protein n=1 Tax=Cucumis melo TaxID=3656 RepID=A0A9I9E0W3_CUCME
MFIYVGGRSLAFPENSDSAGTLYDAVPRSLTISNHNLTTDTDTLLLEFPNQPLTTNVYVRNNAKASVPLLWSRVQESSIIQRLVLSLFYSIHLSRKLPFLTLNSTMVQPLNQNPSRANEKVGPFVLDLNSVLKGTTYLLSHKRVGVNFVLHPLSLAIHSILSLKWEAYWANNDELPSSMQI